MARKKKTSGWTMFAFAVLIGLWLGPAIMALCLLVAAIKALKNTD